MLKAQQILGDNLIDLFEKILIFTLNKYNKFLCLSLKFN